MIKLKINERENNPDIIKMEEFRISKDSSSNPE
jgi:hypothetical protein